MKKLTTAATVVVLFGASVSASAWWDGPDPGRGGPGNSWDDSNRFKGDGYRGYYGYGPYGGRGGPRGGSYGVLPDPSSSTPPPNN